MPLSQFWQSQAPQSSSSDAASASDSDASCSSSSQTCSAQPADDHCDVSDRASAADMSDSENHDDAAEAAAALLKLKRRQQTEKARIQSLLSRQKKKLEHENTGNEPADSVATFQTSFSASKMALRNWWNPFEPRAASSAATHREDSALGRRRAVWLYFRSFAKAVKRLFLGDGPGDAGQDNTDRSRDISHVISVNINDDTNVKLTSCQRGAKTVRSVMCNVQQVFVALERQTPQNDRKLPTYFQVHQPLVPLQRATAHHLCQQVLSWALSFAHQTGKRWQAWGVPDDLFRHVHRHVFVLASDALRANDSLFSELTKMIHYRAAKQQEDGQDCHRVETAALQVHCAIHQHCLTRRTVVLGFKGFWSTLVRLGHLYESHSFRTKFAASLAKVVREHFHYIVVANLPVEAAT